MEPGEDLRSIQHDGNSEVHLRLTEPEFNTKHRFNPKVLSHHRPPYYIEFLASTLKDRPTRPGLMARLIPIRHGIIFVLLLLLVVGVCAALGHFFWRVVLPAGYLIEQPDTAETLFVGWLIHWALFALGVFGTWTTTMIGIFCCGRGLNIWPSL